MLNSNIDKRVRVKILSKDVAEFKGIRLDIHNRAKRRKLKPTGSTTYMQLRFSILGGDQYYLVFEDMI